jgi:hypothetical protein
MKKSIVLTIKKKEIIIMEIRKLVKIRRIEIIKRKKIKIITAVPDLLLEEATGIQQKKSKNLFI